MERGKDGRREEQIDKGIKQRQAERGSREEKEERAKTLIRILSVVGVVGWSVSFVPKFCSRVLKYEQKNMKTLQFRKCSNNPRSLSKAIVEVGASLYSSLNMRENSCSHLQLKTKPPPCAVDSVRARVCVRTCARACLLITLNELQRMVCAMSLTF